MKRLFFIAVVLLTLVSCNDSEKGRFTVNGDFKHIPDQKVFLEELHFGNANSEILDTAEIKNGKFTLSALAQEEGLYMLRLDKTGSRFIFINDKPSINFSADKENISLDNISFNSPANILLKNFFRNYIPKENELYELVLEASNAQRMGNDSIVAAMQKRVEKVNEEMKKFITTYADTASDPIIAMFAIDTYKDSLEISQAEIVITKLPKRFPEHKGIANYTKMFSEWAEYYKKKPQIGKIAPEITMADTSGKSFSLSSLKGKYVLIDFWASWCGPCRNENPNVVNAYNTFKDKNFTVLGVSLDNKKESWVNAIKEDGLTWNHISDLKKWESAAVPLYGLEGIPYNVLIDPQGKIIGTNLTGPQLPNKLAEILK